MDFYTASRVWQGGKVGTILRLYTMAENIAWLPNIDGYASVRWDSGELAWIETDRLSIAILCPACTLWMAAGFDYLCPACRLLIG